MIVGLPELKLHLRVDESPEYTVEDALIRAYASAAETMVKNWIGRPFYAEAADLPAIGAPEYDADQIVADDAIRVAVKMMTERFYQNRGGEGGAAEDAVPPASVRALLAGHRIFARLPASQLQLRTGPLLP